MTLARSTIAQKAIVAITGLILFGFVIVHLAGNMLLFVGPAEYNAYAMGIKGNLPLLWGARITLLTSVVLHIGLTVRLARRAARARPDGYRRRQQDLVITYAARTMVLTGPLLALYLIFHIAHFTAPGLDLGGRFSDTNVYANVVRGFRVWWVSGIYMFANFLLGLHLYHGAWSALQSLGAQHERWDKLRNRAAIGLALVISVGNVFIPFAAQTGLIGSDDQLAESLRLEPQSLEREEE